MRVISFFTVGTSYEREVRLFEESLRRVGMKSEIIGVEDRGSWDLNVARKPEFIKDMRRKIPGPLLYLDVDAFVHRNCEAYFDHLAGSGVDFAAHWFAGPRKGHDFSTNCACLAGRPCDRPHRLLSGTLFFGDTVGARKLLDVWIGYNVACSAAGWKSGGGQKNLWAVVTSRARDFRQVQIPGRYCYVFDKARGYPAGEPRIIEHTLASRDNRARKRRTVARARRIEALSRGVGL